MSISFATKISTLRRERNITQKAAADDLGISQALLSHYEKGIRECNLDFVVKAAIYYNVSTDYLLGLSDTKHGLEELSDDSELPSDSQLNSKTILRSVMFLQNLAETDNEAAEMFFNDFFALSVKKYLSVITVKKKLISDLCDTAMHSLIPANTESTDPDAISSKAFIKTIDSYTNDLIRNTLKNI
ncbi:MAG: helix-turn-helix transcriptional regulator [Ruminococcaceae bacterium]|nr:helix-turn-helix transcriptional regulator [Oscillospiraceae bacterium]